MNRIAQFMRLTNISLLLIFSALLIGCATSSDDDAMVGTEDSGKGRICTLKVMTNEIEDEGGLNSSNPIVIYVFAADGHCVAKQQLTSSQEQLSFTLKEGYYDIAAVAGIQVTNSSLPSVETATLASVITPEENIDELMVTSQSVVLSYGETNFVMLALKRKVAQLKSVRINRVPQEVTAVSITLSPLYSGVTLSGELAGEKNYKEVELMPFADYSWRLETPLFLLPSSGPMTIKVKLTTAEGTKSYSYLTSHELAANHMLNIQGTCNLAMTVDLTGSITTEDWAGERTISFRFDNEGSTWAPTTIEGETVPLVGTLFRGCYVLASQEMNANETKVTLLMPEKIMIQRYLDTVTEEDIKTELEDLLDSKEYGGLYGWRTMDVDEIQIFWANYENINSIMSDYDNAYIPIAAEDLVIYTKPTGYLRGVNAEFKAAYPLYNRDEFVLKGVTDVVFTK